MKILDIISETTPTSGPPTDPDAYLKWWYKNAPQGHTGMAEPKGSWWSKNKENYMRWEPYYKQKWGWAFAIMRTLEIAIPVYIYHDSMLQLNELLKKSPAEGRITPEQAVGMRNNAAGWLVTSIILPRLTVGLVKGVATEFIGGLLEAGVATGGKSGAKAKLLISAISAGAFLLTTVVLNTQEGRNFLRKIGADIVVYGIGHYTTEFIDWLWSFLPKSWQEKLDSTPEVTRAVQQVDQADKDLDAGIGNWQDAYSADARSRIDSLRRNAGNLKY